MLEDKLKRFSGAILLVSHDRELLDGVCSEIWNWSRVAYDLPWKLHDFCACASSHETAMAEYEAQC